MAVISWDNYVDDSTIVNNSDGTETLTVQNLKTRQIGDVFRQTFAGAGNVIVDFDLGSAKATDLICILNHTMAGYTYTISFGTTTGASDVGSETGTLWTGTAYDTRNEMLYLASAHTARYVRVAVAIPGAESIDVGRIWLDSAWGYSSSMDFSIGVIDRGSKTKSRGGDSYTADRQKLRKLDMRAYGLNNDDFYGNSSDPLMKSFLTMDLAVGETGEIVCIPLHANQHEKQRSGVYGTISKNNPIRVKDKATAGYISEKSFTCEEDKA
jgi:hypothetical protein